MGKKILWVVLALVVILGILVWRVFANLDAIVASIIETEGSKALGTEVAVSGVTLDLTSGKAGISGLTIANPDGFSGGDAFALDSIEVQIDIASLQTDVFVIDSVNIGGSSIAYELKADGSNNFQALMDGMSSGGDSSGGDSGPGTKLIIDKLNFAGSNITVTSEMEGVENQDVNLPGFNMSGVGRPNGATSGEVAKAVAGELTGAVIAAAAKAGLQKKLEEEKQGFMDRVKDKLGGD